MEICKNNLNAKKISYSIAVMQYIFFLPFFYANNQFNFVKTCLKRIRIGLHNQHFIVFFLLSL